MYEVNRQFGKVYGVTSKLGFHPKFDDNPHWQEFLTWNSKQPIPLDLSDKAPDPIPDDPDKPPLDTFINKLETDPDGVTVAQMKQALKLLLKRVRRSI